MVGGRRGPHLCSHPGVDGGVSGLRSRVGTGAQSVSPHVGRRRCRWPAGADRTVGAAVVLRQPELHSADIRRAGQRANGALPAPQPPAAAPGGDGRCVARRPRRRPAPAHPGGAAVTDERAVPLDAHAAAVGRGTASAGRGRLSPCTRTSTARCSWMPTRGRRSTYGLGAMPNNWPPGCACILTCRWCAGTARSPTGRASPPEPGTRCRSAIASTSGKGFRNGSRTSPPPTAAVCPPQCLTPNRPHHRPQNGPRRPILPLGATPSGCSKRCMRSPTPAAGSAPSPASWVALFMRTDSRCSPLWEAPEHTGDSNAA